MRQSTEYVHNWRKNTKRRIVLAMGSKCCCCGYQGCIEALELHHVDPNEKEFTFGKARINITSWAKIVEELRKCIMACANCHREIHAGLRQIPANPVKFNEEYVNYKDFVLKDNEYTDECPVCKNLKLQYRKTCSPECMGKLCSIKRWGINGEFKKDLKIKTPRKRKVENRPSKEELQEMVNTMPMTTIAKKYNVSDNAIRKWCKSYGITWKNWYTKKVKN